MKIDRKKRILFFIAWSLVLLWMGVIYSLPAQVATDSNNLSYGVTEVVVEVIETVVPSAEIDVESLNHVLRKNAHFLAYLVLGLLVSHAFFRHDLYGREVFFRTLGICVLYAVSDEVHQMLVPGVVRAALDVMFDSAGACLGILLFSFVVWFGNRTVSCYRCPRRWKA